MKPLTLPKRFDKLKYILLPKEATESVQLRSGVDFTEPGQPEPWPTTWRKVAESEVYNADAWLPVVWPLGSV